MAKATFTASQQRAVVAQGTNILVSASAGSGKTTVLVERVIQKILHGTSIDELLVVTFTDAAATEMRQRIQTALEQAIQAATPGKQQQELRHQLTLLSVANISTLHAFCLQLIQRYYYVIDLDPEFRLLTDDTENLLLREEVWDELREKLYGDGANDFTMLVQNFSNDRNDDGLNDLVFRLFDFANANPDPVAWLTQLVTSYQVSGSSLTASEFFQKQLRPLLEAQLTQAQNDLASARQLAVDELEKFSPVLASDGEKIQQLQTTLEADNWNTIRQNLTNFKFERAPGLRKLSDEAKATKEQILEYRKQVKKQISQLAVDYFALDEQQALNVMQAAAKLIQSLVDVVRQFSDAFTKEKRRRHVLDFSDFEHLTLQILTANSESGQQTRQTLQQKFSEVLVDEYQDINRLQETILTTVAKNNPGNLFMVGDVKQSIYAFRLADPGLFLAKYKEFTDSAVGERIVLADNFRSVTNVTNFINLLFSQLMDEQVGEMAYDDSAKLVASAKYPPMTPHAEVMIYEAKAQATQEENAEPVDESFSIDDKAQGQIMMAGQRIKKLIADHSQIYDRHLHPGKQRDLKYQDIVLLTPTRKNNLVITELFKQLGIPVVVNDAQNYFQTTEIQIMMALLSVIDNPYQDIPLVSVLRSPIVGLDENELAFLRITKRTGDYYAAVVRFHQNFTTGNEFQQKLAQKIDRFLGQLDEFRTLARQNQLVTLIWTIYQETGFLDYVGGMPAGAQRQANLHALYERAHAYEASSFKGLFQFVRFIEKMQEKNKDLAEAPTQTTENAVSVMTIHGSKGLEFPVVFLMDANHEFNQTSLRQDYILDDRAGIGITYLEPERRVKIPTPQQVVIKAQVKKRQAAEEMRLLYVALTRAEQQLYIVGSYPDQKTAVKKWQAALQSEHLVLNETTRSNVTNFMDWIGMCLIRHPQFDQELLTQNSDFSGLTLDKTEFKITFANKQQVLPTDPLQATTEAATTWLDETTAKTTQPEGSVERQAQIEQVLNLNYPDVTATQTTAYQSVSEVKRLFDDPDNSEMNPLQLNGAPKGQHRFVNHDFMVPKFMQTVTAPTPAEIGSATHLVLQELDLHVPPTDEIIGETLTRLVEAGILTDAVAKKVNVSNLINFFASSLGKLLLANPDQVTREAPFSMLLPAKQLFADFNQQNDAPVLIHGIMDGYLVLSDQVILFDYKTDRVAKNKPDAGIQAIKQRYSGQLNLYAAALGQILKRPVTAKYLYLLAVGKLVAVN
ncbi:helicase-exonuclease AddAB subunit AddA [Loigolactobacillus iwatensis]|uniref:helicase-exonuclease AddAB subunit AddA n=1 Tax=Loigolactobacillus iwatensis TaxID=1267156 RepID=UPI000F7EEA09|nr:helicase-exonuclease AddAB subunit AddA [Loigolactobacillus iwatensis]